MRNRAPAEGASLARMVLSATLNAAVPAGPGAALLKTPASK